MPMILRDIHISDLLKCEMECSLEKQWWSQYKELIELGMGLLKCIHVVHVWEKLTVRFQAGKKNYSGIPVWKPNLHRGWAKVGQQLSACKTQTLSLNSYLLIIVLFSMWTINLLLLHPICSPQWRRLAKYRMLQRWVRTFKSSLNIQILHLVTLG